MKRILLLIAPVLLFILAFRPVTAITVTGTVTDEKGNPLPGVSIVVKGTRNGTSSGADGTYRILVAGTRDILVFSAIGYGTREEKLVGRAKIDVSLLPASQVMSEVVVTGYGMQRKKDLTGTVAGVPASPYSTQNYAGYGLQGKIAGV